MNEFENNVSPQSSNPTLPEIMENLKKLLNWKMSAKEKGYAYDGKNGLLATSKIAGMAEIQLLKDINRLDAKTKNIFMTIIGRIYSYLQNTEKTTEDSQYTLGEIMDDLIRLSKWEIVIKKKEITGEDGLLATRRIAQMEEKQLMEDMKRLDPMAKEVLKTMISKIYNYLQPKKEEYDER